MERDSLPDGRSHFEGSTFIHKGRIVVVGGRCNSSKPARNVVGDLLEYDPKADAWSVVGVMPEKVMAPSAAIIAGRLVVIGGGLNNPRPLTAATWIAPIPASEQAFDLAPQKAWQRRTNDQAQKRR